MQIPTIDEQFADGTPRPKVGAVYSDGLLEVEVRAVCAASIVTDGERCFRPPEFAARFMGGRDERCAV